MWKITAISLQVLKWAEWDMVFLWQEDRLEVWEGFSHSYQQLSKFHQVHPSRKSDCHGDLPGEEAETLHPGGHGHCSFGWATSSCPGCDTGWAINKLDKYLKGVTRRVRRGRTWVRRGPNDALQGGVQVTRHNVPEDRRLTGGPS